MHCLTTTGVSGSVTWHKLHLESVSVTQVHFAGLRCRSLNLHHFKARTSNRVVFSSYSITYAHTREDRDLFAHSQTALLLRHILSVGEPLNPEVIRWGEQVLLHTILWHLGTKLRPVPHMISNRAGLPVKHGLMGQPVEQGIEAVILDGPGMPCPSGEQGNIVSQTGLARSMFVYLPS